MYKSIQGGLVSNLSDVEIALKIYLLVPVSNAPVERPFNVVERIKM